jgi:hypothetical protein
MPFRPGVLSLVCSPKSFGVIRSGLSTAPLAVAADYAPQVTWSRIGLLRISSGSRPYLWWWCVEAGHDALTALLQVAQIGRLRLGCLLLTLLLATHQWSSSMSRSSTRPAKAGNHPSRGYCSVKHQHFSPYEVPHVGRLRLGRLLLALLLEEGTLVFASGHACNLGQSLCMARKAFGRHCPTHLKRLCLVYRERASRSSHAGDPDVKYSCSRQRLRQYRSAPPL